jgi:hypothetical protein
MVTNVKELKRRLHSFLINFFMFKILFARVALFKAISKHSKSIERPTEKGLSGRPWKEPLTIVLKRHCITELPIRTADRTLAEARETINKKVTVVLEEVQG